MDGGDFVGRLIDLAQVGGDSSVGQLCEQGLQVLIRRWWCRGVDVGDPGRGRGGGVQVECGAGLQGGIGGQPLDAGQAVAEAVIRKVAFQQFG